MSINTNAFLAYENRGSIRNPQVQSKLFEKSEQQAVTIDSSSGEESAHNMERRRRFQSITSAVIRRTTQNISSIRFKRDSSQAPSLSNVQSRNDTSMIHLRNITAFINSVLIKSNISDENTRQYFLNLVSSLDKFDLKKLFTHPDIKGPLDLAMVLEQHLKSGITRNRLIDLALNRSSRDNPITAKEVRILPILKLMYYFWEFYQASSLDKVPILEGFIGEINTKLYNNFFHPIKLEARTLEVVQAFLINGETLGEKGKDSGGKNIFTGIALYKIALSNAARKKPDDLAKDPLIQSLPSLRGCSEQEVKAIVQAALRELDQDSNYMIGSVEHSLASTVMLYSRMWGWLVPANLGNKKQLMVAFGRICEEYDNNRRISNPASVTQEYNPRDYAALHLVHAMGVEEDLKKELIAEKLLKATTANAQKEAQDISAEEWYAKVRTHFSQAIDAEYGFGIAAKPTKTGFIINILQRLTGWSEERIRSEKRNVSYRDTYGRRGSRTRYRDQTLFEECLYRTDNHYYKWPNPGYSYDSGQYILARMRLPSGAEINAGMVLEQEEESYNKALPNRALGTARMNLWREGKSWTKENIDAEIARLVANHKVETQEEFEQKKERVELRQLIEGIIVPGLNNLDAAIVAFKEGRPKEGVTNLLIGWATFWGTVALGGIGGRQPKPPLSSTYRSRQILADDIAHGFSAHAEELGIPEAQKERSNFLSSPLDIAPKEKDISIPDQFAELAVDATGEYLHPVKNEKFTVAWVRFFDGEGKQKLRLSLLQRKLGSSRSYIELDWRTGKPMNAWRTIYKQEEGLFISGGLPGGGPKKNPRNSRNPARSTEGAGTSQTESSQRDRETYLSTVGDEQFQQKVRQLYSKQDYRKKFMPPAEIERTLKDRESQIKNLIKQKAPASSKQIDALFQEKMQLLSKKWTQKIHLLGLYPRTNPDRASRMEKIFEQFSKDPEPLTFFERHPETEELMPTEKATLDRQFLENEAKIFRLEQEENRNPEALEKLLGGQIRLLIEKMIMHENDGNYLESLNAVDNCNKYIESLLQLWDKGYSVPEKITSHEMYKLLHDGSSPSGKIRAYLKHYLASDLQEADNERGTVTPRDENGKITTIDGSAYENPEHRKNLIDEFKKSIFGRYLMQTKFLTQPSEPIFADLLRTGDKRVMLFFNNALDVLSDLAHYEGDFRPWAEALVRASEKGENPAVVERLIEFQGLIKRLSVARARNDVLEQVAVQTILANRKDDFGMGFFEYARVGYLKLINKVAQSRIQDPFSQPSFTNAPLELINMAKENELLFAGRPLGRRMGMAINQAAYAPKLSSENEFVNLVRSESTRFSLEIDEDLLQSQALNEKIKELKSNDIADAIEEPPDDAYDVDELPDSPEEQQRWLEFYRNKLRGEANQQAQRQTPPRSAGKPLPKTAATSSIRPKPAATRTPMDDKVDRYIALYFWKDLREGLLKGGIPSIEIETSANTRIILDVRALRHILKRHFPKTFDPTLAKAKNSLVDLSRISEVMPMFKELGSNMDKKQLAAHYAKMRANPTGTVLSKISSSYKGKPYWACLANSRMTSIFPK